MAELRKQRSTWIFIDSLGWETHSRYSNLGLDTASGASSDTGVITEHDTLISGCYAYTPGLLRLDGVLNGFGHA